MFNKSVGLLIAALLIVSATLAARAQFSGMLWVHVGAAGGCAPYRQSSAPPYRQGAAPPYRVGC